MSEAAPARRPAAGRPLFLRIFVLLLGSIVAVQAMNAVLVFVTPPPAPRFFSLDQIERALKGGELDAISREERASPGFQQGEGPREQRIRDLLIKYLQVAPDDVRVRLQRPGILQRSLGQFRPFAFRGQMRSRQSLEGVIGDFTCAVRRDPQHWLVVSPAGIDLALWRWRALATLFIALLIAAPIAWWLSRRVARPIAMFGAAAERLGRDPRSPPLELSGLPEVADAAAAFNKMQDRLQRYVADRALMLGAVAHDLRTPLMRITLHLEHAPLPIRSAVEGEIKDMQEMLAAVLAFLRNQEQPPRRQRLDLRSIVESVSDELTDEGHQLELAAGPPLVLDGDPTALKTLAVNLMRNAAIHAGGAIAVSLGADATIVWLEVADRGPGIDQEMLERMFEPFVRGDASRSRETGGIGLGLASARGVARGHGGDVTLARREVGGLVARAVLAR